MHIPFIVYLFKQTFHYGINFEKLSLCSTSPLNFTIVQQPINLTNTSSIILPQHQLGLKPIILLALSRCLSMQFCLQMGDKSVAPRKQGVVL